MVYAVDIKGVFLPASKFNTFGDIVSVVVKNAFVLAGIISFILLIIGGLGIIAGSGGDAKQMEQAKKSVTGAVIGLIIVVTSVLIVQVIATITGSPQLKTMIGLGQ